MRIGILSDTHDQITRTRIAIQTLCAHGAEALIHCGDLTSAAIVELLAVRPAWFVLGNHDADTVPELNRAASDFGPICLGWSGMIELFGRRLGVVHGHMTMDVRRRLAERPDFLLSGHSHMQSDTTIEGIRRINPGTLHRADRFTVALLDLESDELLTLPIESSTHFRKE